MLIVKNPFKLEPVSDPVYLFLEKECKWLKQNIADKYKVCISWHAATSTMLAGNPDPVVIVNGGLSWNKEKDNWEILPMSEILIFTEKNEKVEVDLLSFTMSNETYISDHSIIMFKNQFIVAGGMSSKDPFSKPVPCNSIFIFYVNQKLSVCKEIDLPVEYSSA